MPPGVQLVAFADDVAIVGIGHTGVVLEQILNPALSRVNQWMSKNGLKLTPQKSESCLPRNGLTIRQIYQSMGVR